MSTLSINITPEKASKSDSIAQAASGKASDLTKSVNNKTHDRTKSLMKTKNNHRVILAAIMVGLIVTPLVVLVGLHTQAFFNTIQKGWEFLGGKTISAYQYHPYKVGAGIVAILIAAGLLGFAAKKGAVDKLVGLIFAAKAAEPDIVDKNFELDVQVHSEWRDLNPNDF